MSLTSLHLTCILKVQLCNWSKTSNQTIFGSRLEYWVRKTSVLCVRNVFTTILQNDQDGERWKRLGEALSGLEQKLILLGRHEL